MDLLLQLWAASFYLANKGLFAIAEARSPVLQRQLKIVGWLVYILGVPPWVIIMVGKNNWIAAAIEAGGIPAMVLGLMNVIRGYPSTNRWVNRSVEVFTYSMIVLGVGFSLHEYGGLFEVSQLLEMGVMIGFLMGGYFMARGNLNGWLFFALMNLSMGSLTLLQGKPVLAIQQGLSLCFVMYGYFSARQRRGAGAVS